MSCISKRILTPMTAITRLSMITNPIRLFSAYEFESESSSSEYHLFFPSFYREHMSDIIEFHASKSQLLVDPTASCSLTEPLNKYPKTCPGFEDKPHYSYDSDEPVNVQKGQHLDVISLLSTRSDNLVRIGSHDVVKANDLRGKYILLCCGFVPSMWIDSYKWRNLSLLSSELLSRTHTVPNNIEIVIVPKMRQKWDNDEGVLHHFFSPFSGCLTVPFAHKYRRDYICKSLGFEGGPKFVFVDPSQKVLQTDCHQIIQFGALGFPFTDEHYSSLCGDLDWTEPCPPSIKSLSGLLCCESNPEFQLRKFDSDETISVQQLNKKDVGLYIFRLGNSLKIIHDIHRQCLNQGLDFEIVLVCLPVNPSIDPEMYRDIIHCVLRKHKVSDWWVFPYNNSACARFNRLTSSSADCLFSVGPGNRFVREQAGCLIEHFGSHFGTRMYPFTMVALLRAFLQRLHRVTLKSFLKYGYLYQDHECDDGNTIPVSELTGKNVVVYVKNVSGNTSQWEDEWVDGISHWYDIIKERDPDLEVVFVPVMYHVPDSEQKNVVPRVREYIFRSRMKWLVCPSDDPQQSRYLENHDAFLLSGKPGLEVPAVLAFGKDGHLHSQYALRLFNCHGLDAYPFLRSRRNMNLCREITHELLVEFDLWDPTVAI